MHRRPLLDMLAAYEVAHPDEKPCAERIRALVEGHTDCFERTCLPGHVTASAWIVSADHDRALLTHHRKLERWLQLGGHSDGDPDVVAVALREAEEESGMTGFEVLSRDADGRPVPLDLDVHLIPARKEEPAHEHHDVRFLLRAPAGQALVCSDESLDLAWFGPDELEDVATEESLARMWRKANALLGAIAPSR